jgi:hypothetical protein
MRRPVLLAIMLGLALPALAQAPFMSSAEVKPIMELTKGSWVAVREYDGQDLVYFTHLEAMRCGIQSVRYGINVPEPDTDWVLAECDRSLPNPNEIAADHVIYATLELGSVQTVVVELTFDDGSVLLETFERAAVMTP